MKKFLASVALYSLIAASSALAAGWPGYTQNGASAGGGGSGCTPSGSSGQILTDNGSSNCTSNSTGAGVMTAAGVAVNAAGGFATVRTPQTFSNAGASCSSAANRINQIGTMSASRTLTLCAANTYAPGDLIIVQDTSGTVTSTNTIVVARAGSDTFVGGGTTDTISVAGCGAVYQTDGVSLFAKVSGCTLGTGTLTDTKFCTYTASGATIGCATSGATIIAAGTSTLNPGALTSGTCSSAVATSATGTATTDTIDYAFNVDLTATTGYSGVGTTVTVYKYPTANTVNWKICNWTGSSITPTSVVVNWSVRR